MSKKKKKNKVDLYIDNLHAIEGKLVIVTGANSGLGFEIAKIALLKGAKVVMACRNIDRATKAKEKLIKETGRDCVDIELYNQSDFASINSFAKTIQSKYSSFYSLILNAGTLSTKEAVDEFHISNVYKNNYLGALSLLMKLNNFIQVSDRERRIIIQGSMASFMYKYTNKTKDAFIYGEYKLMKVYAMSKLCCSNLYVFFRDHNKNPNVKYLLCEPGVASTNLFNQSSMWFKKPLNSIFKGLTNTARVGCLSACKLMCDVCANGDYYRPHHLFSAKGLPKKAYFNDKFINEDIITEGLENLKIYEK